MVIPIGLIINHFGNSFYGNWHYDKAGLLVSYTLSQKKRNILEVAFLLEKSVYQWIWGYSYFWMRFFENCLENRFAMIQGHMTLTLGPRKNPWRKVAFHLRLSVPGGLGELTFWMNSRCDHLKLPHLCMSWGAAFISETSPSFITRAIPISLWYSMWQCMIQNPAIYTQCDSAWFKTLHCLHYLGSATIAFQDEWFYCNHHSSLNCWASLICGCSFEPPLGVIPEQGASPVWHKGARSKL